MNQILSQILIIAEDAQPEVPAFSLLESPLVPMMVIGVLFYFVIWKPQKSKEQSFTSMIDNLKEKDRVVTIGGIHGVVTNIQREREEVTLRVDESTGAKLRVGVSAIARVVTDESKSES